ncbi:MAG: ImuA family protein, partial [Pirellulales bacterium]
SSNVHSSNVCGSNVCGSNVCGSNVGGSNVGGSNVGGSNVGGSGAGTLALIAAREAARQGGAIVVIDRQGLFYPPAALRLQIGAEQLIVVRPESDEDTAWALDQALRTRGVAAAWCAVGAQDEHTLRRWQLAAETGGAIGLLLRPQAVRHEPSWAELRLGVEPLAQPREAARCRRLRVTLLRARFGHAGRSVEIEIPTSRTKSRGTSDETRFEHMAAPVAPAKTRRRARRA